MTKIIDHRYAHLLSDKYHSTDQSMVIVVHDNREARLLENELSLYIDTKVKLSISQIMKFFHMIISQSQKIFKKNDFKY